MTASLRLIWVRSRVTIQIVAKRIGQAYNKLAVFVGDHPGVLHPAIDAAALLDRQFALELLPNGMWIEALAPAESLPSPRSLLYRA